MNMNSKKVFLLLMSILVVRFAPTVGGGGGAQLGDGCQGNTDCSDYLDNSYCEASVNVCVCLDGYYEVGDDTCTKVLGDRSYGCDFDCDCSDYVPHSVCINRTVCACETGYIEENGNTCVAGPSVAKQLGEQCICRNSGNSNTTVKLTTLFLTLVVAIFHVQ